jgi:hypothetical protein
VLEHFFREHRTRDILYVLDSFGFYDRSWNEDRFADAKLIGRTPFDPNVAQGFLHYALEAGVDPRAPLDYVSGFSKINNRERFQRDAWEGEAQFERSHRPSSAADAKRIGYLYPGGSTDPQALTHYLEIFGSLLDLATQEDARVTIIKPPLPPQFYRKLPNEAAFDEAVSRLLEGRQLPFRDFSEAIANPRSYFDTDHLNRTGLGEFFACCLKPILTRGGD